MNTMFPVNQPFVPAINQHNGNIIPTIQSAESEIITNLQLQLQGALAEINQLKNQIFALQGQNNRSAQTQKREEIPKNKSYSPANSDEEEEIIERETDWLLPKSNRNKKRKATESPEKVIDSPKKPSEKTPKHIKPPPVILSNVDDYSAVKNKIDTGKFDYKTIMLNSKQIKINVNSAEEYRKLTALVKETDLEWHTYENKSCRPIRVMVRNLHQSTSCDEISNELKERNFKITEVVQKFKKTTINNKTDYSRLPLFMLVFDTSEDIKKIYDIQYINHMKVKIEAIRNSKLIPQCKRCQRHGHTQRFCKRTPACVKCAGNHLTASCTKLRNTPAKCINCNEEHPANYRGCIIAKQLQRRRDDANKPKKILSQQRSQTQNTVRTGVSYTQATQNKPVEPTPTTMTTDSTMMNILQSMMKTLERVNERLDRLEARTTGAIPKKK